MALFGHKSRKLVSYQVVHIATKLATYYRTQEYLVWEKMVNHQVFAKIFLANIHRYTEIVFGICSYELTSLFAKFFLAISFYFYGSPEFFLC